MRRGWWWLGTGAATALVYVALLATRTGVPVDLAQPSQPISALLSGHVGAVFAPDGAMTSPPGFVLLAAPLVAGLGGHLLAGSTWLVVGGLVAATVPVAAIRLLAVLRPDRPPHADAGLIVATMVGAPFLYAVKVDYHPEDLLAVTFLLVAVERTVRHRPLGAGLALAALLLTRQWGLLAAGPLLAAQGGASWRRTAAVTTGVCTAVLAPFALVSPVGLFRALSAADVVSGGSNALFGHVPLPAALRYAAARLGPVAACVPVTAVLARAWRRRPPAPQMVASACLAAVALRMVFETDSLDYYLAPTMALAVLLATALRGRPAWLLALAAAAIEAALVAEPALPAASQVPVAAGMAACYLVCVGTGFGLALGLRPRLRPGAALACPSG